VRCIVNADINRVVARRSIADAGTMEVDDVGKAISLPRPESRPESGKAEWHRELCEISAGAIESLSYNLSRRLWQCIHTGLTPSRPHFGGDNAEYSAGRRGRQRGRCLARQAFRFPGAGNRLPKLPVLSDMQGVSLDYQGLHRVISGWCKWSDNVPCTIWAASRRSSAHSALRALVDARMARFSCRMPVLRPARDARRGRRVARRASPVWSAGGSRARGLRA
jgi:hypothetical protein